MIRARPVTTEPSPVMLPVRTAAPQRRTLYTWVTVEWCARRMAVLALPLWVTFLCPGLAHGQALADAESLYRTADFQGALETLAAAELQATDRSELTRVLTLRALVLSALGQERVLDQTLRELAALDPEFEFGFEAPPPLRDRFARLRASVSPLAVEVSAERQGAGVVVSAEAAHLPPRLEGRLLVGVRDGEFGAWQMSTGPATATLDVPMVRADLAHDVLLYYAALLGPGPAEIVLATDGDEGAPLRLPLADIPPRLGAEAAAVAVDDSDDPDWPWIVGGSIAAVIAVVGVVVGVVVAGAEDEGFQRVSPPDSIVVMMGDM